MSKKVTVNIDNFNKKVVDNYNELNSNININKDNISKLNTRLDNENLKHININNKDFDLTITQTPKELKFSPTYYGNLDENNMIPYPKNFTTDEPMVNGIKNGEQAIKYINNVYQDLITDLPKKVDKNTKDIENINNKLKLLNDILDFNKNWKQVSLKDLTRDKWYIFNLNKTKETLITNKKSTEPLKFRNDFNGISYNFINTSISDVNTFHIANTLLFENTKITLYSILTNKKESGIDMSFRSINIPISEVAIFEWRNIGEPLPIYSGVIFS